MTDDERPASLETELAAAREILTSVGIHVQAITTYRDRISP